jgi:hypothetical protein
MFVPTLLFANSEILISARTQMNNDPRWQQALRLLRQAAVAHDRGDADAMARAFEAYCNTLDSLAVDPAVARDERRRAAKLLEKTDGQIRANLPALLRRVVELRDTATNADERAEFAAILARAAEQLPAGSNARH